MLGKKGGRMGRGLHGVNIGQSHVYLFFNANSTYILNILNQDLTFDFYHCVVSTSCGVELWDGT